MADLMTGARGTPAPVREPRPAVEDARRGLGKLGRGLGAFPVVLG